MTSKCLNYDVKLLESLTLLCFLYKYLSKHHKIHLLISKKGKYLTDKVSA